MNIEIANRLVNLRKNNNLSQEALAEKLGISRQAVSKWERAEASPDTDNLILLARLYGVSLDELLQTNDEIVPRTDIEDNGFKQNNTFNGNNQSTFNASDSTAAHALTGIITLAIVITYILIGCLFNAWHPGWVIFLFIPIWHSIVEAISKRNANHFAYPVLATLVFLILGVFGGLWHPGWVVFITIPLYYAFINFILILSRNHKNNESIITEEENKTYEEQ